MTELSITNKRIDISSLDVYVGASFLDISIINKSNIDLILPYCSLFLNSFEESRIIVTYSNLINIINDLQEIAINNNIEELVFIKIDDNKPEVKVDVEVSEPPEDNEEVSEPPEDKTKINKAPKTSKK